MLAVSNSIKNAYNQYTTKRKSKIKVGNNEYFIQNMSLLADAYDEGNIVGNAIAKTLEFDIETEYVKGLDEFVLYDGVWTGEQYEYINLGTFKLFEEQGADDFFSHITAYDKLILFKTEFDPNLVQFPTTIYGLLQSICSQAGVTLDTETIVNGNKTLETNLFVENETLKDILRAICQVSGTFAIISEDKLKLKLVGEDVIELEDYQISNPEYKRTTWNINQVVLGMQDIDGEYVQKSDEEDIERNGVHKIVINNNPFTYTQELRQQYIDDLFDKLKGFGYFAFESDWEGLPCVELGDTARIGKEQDYKINLGKNLFNYNDLSSKIQTFTTNGNAKEFTINGVGTYDYPISLIGQYTFSGNWSTTNLNGHVRVVYEDDTTANLLSSYSSSSTSGTINFTTTKNVKAIRFQTYNTSNITITNLQIEQGSQATSYAPYFTPIELCKIGNYRDRIYKSTGKNLFVYPYTDTTTTLNGITFTDNGDGSITINGTATVQTAFYLKKTSWSYNSENKIEEGTYTFNRISINPNIYLCMNIYNPDNTNVFYSSGAKDITFNVSSNQSMEQPRIIVTSGTTVDNLRVYPQLEKGSTPTDYEPYGSKGKWLLTKKIGKVVLDGSESWTTRQGGTSYAYQLFNVFDGNGTNGKCDYWNFKSRGATNSQNEECICSANTNTSISIFTNNNTLISIENFKSWLGTHNVSVYYTLATPTIEEITDSSLINQLENAGVEILGETTQNGTPTPTNPVPINNKTGEITVQNKRKSLVLRYQIKSPDGLNSYLQAPSIIDSVIDYIDNTDSLENKLRRTEYKVDKENSTITNLVQVTTDLDSRTTNNTTTINNNYQELISKFDSVASTDDVSQLRQSMQTTMNEQELKIENIQGILVNGVEKVVTTSGTFDENGLTMEKTGAKTKSILDETGVDVKDTQGSSNEDLFFAGYVDNEKAQSNQKLAPYEGQTVVYSKNSIVENYFTIGTHSRIEDYDDGTGVFYIGG